jgi:hypothetical protein
MLQSRPFVTALALTLVLTSATACKKAEDVPATPPPAAAPAPEPAAVTMVSTGRHLGANNHVSDSTSTFGVHDTMYVAVTSTNTPNGATMTAKFTFQTGQVVDSLTQSVAKTDATNTTTVTEFHVTKATPWPVGKYTVDLMLDGKNVGTKALNVKK